jgi:hypothetical protein
MADTIDTNAMALLASLNSDALDKERDYCGCHRKDDAKYGSDCINCQTKRLSRLEPLLRRMAKNQKAMAGAVAKLRAENRLLRDFIRNERDTIAIALGSGAAVRYDEALTVRLDTING